MCANSSLEIERKPSKKDQKTFSNCCLKWTCFEGDLFVFLYVHSYLFMYVCVQVCLHFWKLGQKTSLLKRLGGSIVKTIVGGEVLMVLTFGFWAGMELFCNLTKLDLSDPVGRKFLAEFFCITLLYNIFSKKVDFRDATNLKQKLTRVYWNYVETQYKELVPCTWRILWLCRQYNPAGKLI